MSFLTKFGANMCKNGLRLLTGTSAAPSSASALATTTRKYHIMTDSRTLALHTSLQTPTAVPAPPLANIRAPIMATGLQRLLTPLTTLFTQVAGFKVKGKLKRRCKDCYFVVRQQRSYVICPTHPRHKQMAMKKRDYKTWILTHATQSKVRPY